MMVGMEYVKAVMHTEQLQVAHLVLMKTILNVFTIVLKIYILIEAGELNIIALLAPQARNLDETRMLMAITRIVLISAILKHKDILLLVIIAIA